MAGAARPLAFFGDSSAETSNRCLRDVVALATLPAIWLGAEPQRIAESFAAAVFAALGPDFVYVALSDGPGRPAIGVDL